MFQSNYIPRRREVQGAFAAGSIGQRITYLRHRESSSATPTATIGRAAHCTPGALAIGGRRQGRGHLPAERPTDVNEFGAVGAHCVQLMLVNSLGLGDVLIAGDNLRKEQLDMDVMRGIEVPLVCGTTPKEPKYSEAFRLRRLSLFLGEIHKIAGCEGGPDTPRDNLTESV